MSPKPDQNPAHDMSATSKKPPSPPSPSASIILISPSNRVLLLHRVQKASSFPSAHVFPGGNLEESDGPLSTEQTDPRRHQDCLAYRRGAIRELFEESGILLARKGGGANGSLLEVSARDRRHGRRAIHSKKIGFDQWLKDVSGGTATLDTDSLIPFTHWITPPNVPKRYTTQMYVYFVPKREEGNESVHAIGDEIETTAAEWMYAREWLDRSRKEEIILFPPQFILLYLVSEILDAGGVGSAKSLAQIERRRAELRRFIEKDGDPVWRDKYISPQAISFGDAAGGRAALALDKPGPELKGSGLKGEHERVVLVRFKKEGPREVEVGWRKDVLKMMREGERGKL